MRIAFFLFSDVAGVGSPTRARIPCFSPALRWRLSMVCICAAMLCGCGTTTTTGVKTQMNADALSRIDSIGVQVTVAEDFSVFLAQQAPQNTGFLAGGIVGAWIEKGTQVSADSNVAKKLRPQLEGINYQRMLSDRLMQNLQTSGRFRSVIAVSTNLSPAPPVDAILALRINHWGLRTGMGTNYIRRAQPALDARVILSQAKGSPIWERTDYFPGGAVYDVDNFSTQEGLLRKELDETFRRYADRLANEIRFAK